MSLYVVQPGATVEALASANTPSIGFDKQSLTQNTIGKLFYTNQSGANTDYQKYLYGSPVKVDHVNEPTHLRFSLVPYDSSFVKLQRGAYVVLFTSTYGYWYSGYITNEPSLIMLGSTKISGVSTPIWGYQYEAVSDEYILNMNPLGIIPPFINTTQGAILKGIIEALCPGTFNTTNIQVGQPVARYVVDPTQRFSDIIKAFSDQSAYRFWSRMKSISFVPYDFNASPITIDGNDKHFTPANLSISMVDEQVINDAVVLGDIEPQNYTTEFFIGDGVTGTFPLGSSVYGVDSSILLSDDFSSSTIDTSKWMLINTINNYLQVANGYCNLLGGDGTGVYGTYLQSISLIPLEGHLRLTHGEWDFVSASSGVIAGLWTQIPNSAFTGCVFGLAVSKSGTNTILNPIVNGVLDTTQSMTIDYTKRYVMRTMFLNNRVHRFNNGWGFLKQNGTTGTASSAVKTDTADISTVITAIDPLTAQIFPAITFSNTAVPLTNAQAAAYYIPAADDDLHCTFTQITISTPLQARLDTRINGTYSYVPQLIGPNELDTLDGQAPTATIIDANTGAQTMSSLLGTPQYNSGAAILQYFKNSVNLTATLPQKGDLVALRYRRPGSAIAHVQNQSLIVSEAAAWGDSGIRTTTVSGTTPLPRNTDECEQLGAATLQDAGYQHFEGSYKQWSMFSFTSEPMAGMVIKFANLPSPPFFSSLQAELITEVQSTFSSFLSGERFEHAITFGKMDRTKQVLAKLESGLDGVFMPQDTTELPFYIDYRQVGITFVPDMTAIPTLFQYQNGNLIPNSDFENAGQYWFQNLVGVGSTIQFITGDFVNSHSGGGYAQLNTATSGSSTQVALNAAYDSAGVNTLFFPVTVGDVITFGGWIWSTTTGASAGQYQINTYNSSKTLVTSAVTPSITAASAWQFGSNTFTIPAGTAYVSFHCVINNPTGATTARFDGASIVNSNRLYIGLNSTPPAGGGFQVRFSDDSWGADPGRNLLVTTTDAVIAVPRNARGKSVFIRPFDARNKIVWSEDITNPAWTLSGSSTVSNNTRRNPDNDISTVTTVNFIAASGSEFFQTTGTLISSATATFSISVKGTSGQKVRLSLQQSVTPFTTISSTITFTGNWQRVNVSGTFGVLSGNIVVVVDNAGDSLAKTFQATRASLELAAAETVYCKTLGTAFGAMSRFSNAVKINLPLIPAAPTATVTYLIPSSPIVNVTLPASLTDVWGVEIRGSDDKTILYHKDLVDVNYLPQFTDTVTLNRNLNYNLHTYNLLNEYSPVTNLAFSIPNFASGNVGTAKNGLYNPGFEIDEIITPYFQSAGGVLNNSTSAIGSYVADAWFIINNDGTGAIMKAFVDRTTGFPRSGASCLLIRMPAGISMANGTQNRMIVASEPIPATPGKYYYTSGYISTQGTLGSASISSRMSLEFLDATGAFVSQVLTPVTTTITGTYGFKDVKAIAPAGAAYVQTTLEFYYLNSSGGTITSALIDTRFDDLFFAQSTDPSFGDVLTTGSLPPTLTGGFSYSSDGSSITWTWTSLNILRADNTTVSVGSGTQTISGLNPSTTYFFYPYYDELLGQLVWLAFASGTGTPAIAYITRTPTLNQQQVLQSRIPLSMGLSAATSAPGGGNTGGGGGSGTICIRGTMLVNHKDKGFIPISTCKVGDYILGKNKRWTRIVAFQKNPHESWIRLTLPDSNYLECTPTHGFTLITGDKRACDIGLGDIMYVAEYADHDVCEYYDQLKSIERIKEPDERVTIECRYDDSTDEEGHLFYAGATAPAILTHNTTIACL